AWLNAKVWARICHHAGLRRLRVHDLRHTYASLQLRRGKPMEYVQQQLGHTAIDTTIRLYAHFKAGASRVHANDLAAGIERFEPAPDLEASALDSVVVRAPEDGAGTPRPPANHPETTRPVTRS
ncbi:MAG TPA: tyrosine-type recombinase/integrase, partial [Methylomirabilota bacterium]|nr:tyrosine-type recombinase/integrase [Methylomirabilota bacterium]